MIKAFIFDMDGTLIDSERLYEGVYADLIAQLSPAPVDRRRITNEYVKYIGKPREAICRGFVEHFGLEDACGKLMLRYGVDEPWQALEAMRVNMYQDMISDPQFVVDNSIAHNVDLARWAAAQGQRLALATSSFSYEAAQILEALDLHGRMELVLGVENVSRPKPDPEIYLRAAEGLGLEPRECLAVEDSAIGATAALAAGMWVLVTPTEWTRPGLSDVAGLRTDWVALEPSQVRITAQKIMDRASGDG